MRDNMTLKQQFAQVISGEFASTVCVYELLTLTSTILYSAVKMY